MQTDPRDKKILPEDLEPTPDQISDTDGDAGKEQDLDELVHDSPDAATSPNEEIDADDVIHNSIRKLPSAADNEIDPDDMVHGHQ
jgi:hypothetical protein